MADGKVTIDTRVNTKGAEKGLEGLAGSLGKIGKLVAAAFSIKAIMSFSKEAIDLASDLNEVQNVVDTAFGKMSYKMEEFAETSIEKFGMSKLAAKQTASTMLAMGSAMGQGLAEGSDMALEITGRLGDVSSFYNKTLEEVKTMGKAIYSGETESLKAIGVLMTEDNLTQFALEKGYSKTYKQMSAQEKLLIRQQYFLKATNLAAGDFEKTQDSWANQTKILSERWKEFMSIIGSGLIAVLKPVVKTLNSIVAAMINIANAIGKVMSRLGIQTKETDNAAGSYDDLADSAEGYGDAATEAGKDAKNATANFDDLNVLAQDSSGGSGSGGETEGVSDLTDIVDATEEAEEETIPWLDTLLDRINQLKDIFKGGLQLELFKGDVFNRIETLRQKLIHIGELLKGIFTDPAVTTSFNSMLDNVVFNLGRVVGAFISIGVTIAENLIGGFEKFLEENSDRIKEYLVNMFDITSEIATLVGNFSSAFANIFSVFGGENAQQITSNLLGIFTSAFMGVQQLCAKAMRDIIQLITQPIVDNQEKIKTALDGLLGTIAKVTGTVKKFIDEVMDKLNQFYDEHIKPFVDDVTEDLSYLLGIFLDNWNTYIQPVLDLIAEEVDDLFTNYISPAFDQLLEALGYVIDLLSKLWNEALVPLIEWIIENIMPVLQPILTLLVQNTSNVFKTITTMFKEFFKMFGDIIKSITEILGGVIDFLVGVFTGDWDKAWQGVTKIFEGVKDLWKGIINGILSIFETMVNGIIKGINLIVEGLNTLSFEVPDWVPGIGGKTLGFDIKKVSEVSLPRLASGAVIPPNKEFMAILGDQKQGMNIETPLDTMIEAFERVAANMLQNASGNNNSVMELDGETFARLEVPYILNEFKRRGYNIAVMEG